MRQIPLILLTGFLGSGKSTLLELLLEHYRGEKLLVVQNDFASHNVDSLRLSVRHSEVKVMDVNNGSLFCVCLLSGFITQLADWIERERPDRIFIEASGLSDPIAIAQLLQAEALSGCIYLDETLCVVDALGFSHQRRMPVVQHQIAVADRVVLNKWNEQTSDESIAEHIRNLNPLAPIVRTEYCRMPLDHPEYVARSLPDEPAHRRPVIQTYVGKTTRQLDRTQMMQLLERQAEHCYRIKGYVNCTDGICYAVQGCSGRVEMVPIEGFDSPTAIVFLGVALDLLPLLRCFG